MKKIKAKHSNKDRVVCISIPGKQVFYYEAAGEKTREYLFAMNYSGSVFTYFRDKGRNLSGRGFSLTIKELYEFKEYHNHKLAAVMKRIPGQIEYVIRERSDNERKNKYIISRGQESRYFGREDDERAA